MNLSLTKQFTLELTLKNVAPLKALGLDGFNPSFYQTYWHIVGDAVTLTVLKFLNDGIFDNCINFTYIALILKVKCQTNASNFRPISLCNVIHKLASKVLANRLKQILPHIISKNQSAFMPRRLITDNIIIAYEALCSMKTRKRGRKGSMIIKLDIFKAYDRLEWSFLGIMMQNLGFDDLWITKI